MAVTQDGTSVFRAVNFELYARPEGRNKIVAYVGSGVFLSIMCYFTYMGSVEEAPASKPAAAA